jgi:hypothetical protein
LHLLEVGMAGYLPACEQAEAMLAEGLKINPGPWADHCRKAGEAARIIASRCPGMDADRAEALGMLHDIGRRGGVMDMRHIVEGYRFAMAMDMPDVARISLTHSFAIKDARTAVGNWDCPEEDVRMVQAFLDGVEYDDYDRLIQLCDYLGDPWGFCILEKRMVDVTLRRGFNEFTLDKWRAAFGLKKYFEKKMGTALYPLLPGIEDYIVGERGPSISRSTSP